MDMVEQKRQIDVYTGINTSIHMYKVVQDSSLKFKNMQNLLRGWQLHKQVHFTYMVQFVK